MGWVPPPPPDRRPYVTPEPVQFEAGRGWVWPVLMGIGLLVVLVALYLRAG